MTDTVPPPTPAALSVRPDVLRLWSPAAVQFMVLVAAVLTAGLFAGNWLHNARSVGDAWQARVRECWAGGPPGSGVIGLVEHQQQYDACMAAAERQRAAYAFGGMVAAAIAAIVVLVVVPGVIGRRRRLRPLSAPLAPTAERGRALAERMGVSNPPELMTGPTKLRDAFSYGLPQRYRIALPPKLAVSFRRAAVLDPVLAHELAHVSRHDVTFAWLARTVWYSIVPVLALPFVVSAMQHDLTLAWDFLWRAAALLAVMRLITARLLRVREYEADLTAARFLGCSSVSAGLSAAAPRAGRRGIGAAFAVHPTPAQRRAVLDDVARLARPEFADGLTAGFLTGMAAPLLLAAFMTLLTGAGLLDLAHLATAVLAGGALGVLVGLEAWRAALVDRLSPRPAPRWPMAVGVGVGLVLGELVSLEHTGTQGVVEPVFTWWLLLLLFLAAGATALIYGLAELWADRAPSRMRAPRAAPAFVGAVVFAAAMTLVLMLEPALGQGVASVAGTLALTRLGLPVAVSVLGLALVATLWTRKASSSGSSGPAWLIAEGPVAWPISASPGRVRAIVYGLLAGGTGGAAIIGYRASVGPAPEALIETRYLYYLILGALVAAAVMLVLGTGLPGVGTGSGLVAAVVATLTVSTAVLLLNVALGGALGTDIIRRTLQGALGLALLLSLVAAVAGLLPGRRALAPRVLAVLTIALSIIVSLAVLRAAPALSHGSEVRAYLQRVATPLQEDGSRLAMTFTAVTADMTSTGEQNAERIRAEVLPLVAAMQVAAMSVDPQDANLGAAHALAIKSLDTAEKGFETMAEALDAYDPVRYQQGFALWMEANQTWAQWRTAVAESAEAVGPSSSQATD